MREIMANKKTSKKDAEKASKKKILIVATFIVVVLAILWAGWWLIFKHNAYTPDKNEVRQDMESLLSAVQPRGEQVYTDIVDQGCNSNSVGLVTSTGCGFMGYKYVKSSSSLAEDLKSEDSQILKAGWERTFYNNQTNASVAQVLDGEGRQLLSYLNPKGFSGTRAFLGYYKDQQNNNDSEIVKLIANGKLTPPKEGEYIYGLRVGASYWACSRNDSLFKICPLPPSSPKSY